MSATTVLSVTSEVFPLIKTGGLADVAGALPAALRGHGIAVRTLVPGYPAVLRALARVRTAASFSALFGGPARLLSARAGDLDLFVVDAPHLFDRPGNPYLGPDGTDWPDNGLRFAALSRVAADLGQGLLPRFRPAVIHCHDWQAGLTPAYLHYAGGLRPATVMTVHNLAFQGFFPAALLGPLGLPEAALTLDGVEYHGGIGFLKAGLRFADQITTVSPTYASEICTSDFGMGLEGLLRGRADVLRGILNGLDTSIWDPASDPLIAARYDATSLVQRQRNKQALQAQLGLTENPAALLLGVVSRLSWQKGLDLLLAALPVLLAEGGQLALLGAGEPALEAAFRDAAAAYPGRVGCVIGYDETLAHRIQAGVDALVVPSRFEPCGLTQLCALRYGAIPVVARVGGLADTIIDANPVGLQAGVSTGVQFAPASSTMLESALRRTSALFRDRTAWARIQVNAMATDVSWEASAGAYAALYRAIAARPSRGRR